MNDCYVNLNNNVSQLIATSLPVDDRGFLYGESVFTTMRCYGGKVFRLEDHVKRINASLSSDILDFGYSVELDNIKQRISKLQTLNNCPEAIARLTISRGRGAGPLPPKDAEPDRLLTVKAFAPDVKLHEEGVRVIISTIKRDPNGKLGRHKLGSYMESLVARREAAAQDAYEAVICGTDGSILECACSNIFIVKDGQLLTPPLKQNLLPGIARLTILECAERASINFEERIINAEDIENADEIFLTNSAIEVLPACEFNGRQITPNGKITTMLTEAYAHKVAEYIKG